MGPFGRGRSRFDSGSLGIFSVLLAQLAGLYFPPILEIFMRKIILIIMLFLLSVPVISDANQNKSDILAEKFLVVTRQKEQNRKLLDLLKAQMSQQMNRLSKADNWDENQRKLIEKYTNKMTDILMEELSWEKIKGNHLKIIKSIYSDEELRSLIHFFESELGQLYINKQQIAMQKLGESSQNIMQNITRRIRAMEQEMKAELGGV
jgi:uncharacterized protein